MKLYSRKQVVLRSVITSIIVLLILLIFGVVKINFKAFSRDDIVFEPKKIVSDANAVSNFFTDMVYVKVSAQYQADELENINIYQRLNEAVVNISIEVVTFNWFLEPVPKQGGSGSGAIIDDRGYILTNRHVVENAYKVNVTLSDGSQYEGNVVGVDPENDLAVIKIEAKGKKLVVIPMGDSSSLMVGQKVLAIGNPFGYERTLTTGIISGLGRPVKPASGSDYVIKDMIQSDASINPGNSGGPMINSKGEMIGINTMIYSPTGGSIGIGFAVPINTAKRVVPDLIKYGKVQRGWIDIETVQLFPELVKYASFPVNKGLLVSKVEKGSNAAKAGIKGGDKERALRYGRSIFYLGGDIIIAIDGIAVHSISDFYGAIENKKVGEVVKVKIMRGAAEMEIAVVLSMRHNNT